MYFKLVTFFCYKVGQKRWKVETFSRLDSVLLLSSVNLPGGELVRKASDFFFFKRFNYEFSGQNCIFESQLLAVTACVIRMSNLLECTFQNERNDIQYSTLLSSVMSDKMLLFF